MDEQNNNEEYEFVGDGIADPDAETVQVTPEQVLSSIKMSINNLNYVHRFCLLLYHGYLEAKQRYDLVFNELQEKRTQLKAITSELQIAYSEISAYKEELETYKTKEKVDDIQRTEETV